MILDDFVKFLNEKPINQIEMKVKEETAQYKG